MEWLAFGSHYAVDGYGASAQTLEDEAHIRAVMRRWAEALEPATEASAEVLYSHADESPGISAGLVLAESHFTLHTFSERRCLTVTLFSRRGLPLEGLVTDLRESFQLGRFESRLSSHGRGQPRDAEALRRALRGERGYADVRLDETLLTRQR